MIAAAITALQLRSQVERLRFRLWTRPVWRVRAYGRRDGKCGYATSLAATHLYRMPRYYFRLSTNDELQDPEGVELPDVARAIAFARCEAEREIARAVAANTAIDANHRIIISDGGREVAAVAFGDVARAPLA
jgi:hypothetical protein